VLNRLGFLLGSVCGIMVEDKDIFEVKGEFVNREIFDRKHPRLKEYDYSQNGYYSVTICTHNKLATLSKVVGRGLAPAIVELTAIGKIVEEELLDLPNRYPSVRIDKYVIMPTHIHVIIAIENGTGNKAGASPRPTLMDVVCAFKSLSTRKCNQADGISRRKIWQVSFHENVIRSREAYLSVWEYIEGNACEWLEEYYVEV